MKHQAPGKKNDALNKRFLLAMEGLGLTGYGLSRELGTSEAVISNIRHGKNPPNIQLVQRMLNKYEELDPGWLLTGKGRMFRSGGRSVEDAEGDQRGPYPIDGNREGGVLERLDRIEALLKRSIEVQMKRDLLTDESISDLEEQLGRMEREVERLRIGPGRGG